MLELHCSGELCLNTACGKDKTGAKVFTAQMKTSMSHTLYASAGFISIICHVPCTSEFKLNFNIKWVYTLKQALAHSGDVGLLRHVNCVELLR